MGLNMATESRNVIVMNVKNTSALRKRNIETIVNQKVGRFGGENG